MRINYSGNKKRREEANRKKQEEKRNKRLNKTKDREGENPVSNENSTVETPPPLA